VLLASGAAKVASVLPTGAGVGLYAFGSALTGLALYLSGGRKQSSLSAASVAALAASAAIPPGFHTFVLLRAGLALDALAAYALTWFLSKLFFSPRDIALHYAFFYESSLLLLDLLLLALSPLSGGFVAMRDLTSALAAVTANPLVVGLVTAALAPIGKREVRSWVSIRRG